MHVLVGADINTHALLLGPAPSSLTWPHHCCSSQIEAASEGLERQRAAVAGELARLQQDVAQHESDMGRPLPQLPEGACLAGFGGPCCAIVQGLNEMKRQDAGCTLSLQPSPPIRALHGLPAGPGEEECQVALAACTSEARELEAAIAAQVCGSILWVQLGQLRQQAAAALMVPARQWATADTTACAGNVQGAQHSHASRVAHPGCSWRRQRSWRRPLQQSGRRRRRCARSWGTWRARRRRRWGPALMLVWRCCAQY